MNTSYKYTSLLLVPVALSAHSLSAAMPTLQPSLFKQMQYQEQVDARVTTDQIKRANSDRLAQIRQQNLARLANQTSTANATTNTPNVATLTITPQIQVASTIVSVVPTIPPRNTTNIQNTSTNNPQYIANIDMTRVQAAWLSWNNDLRASLGLAPYTINPLLNTTAQEWSEFSRDRGYINHARPEDGNIGATDYGYYNFNTIDRWFSARGVNPIIIGSSKHTENLGIGSFTCSGSDCTDQAITAIRKTYDFFLSERSYNGVHYRSMISANFSQIGIGFAYRNGTYYATIHYANTLR